MDGGTTSSPISTSDGSTVIAAFDVDGTLLRGESLLRFLRHLLGAPGLSVACATAMVRVVRRPGRPIRENAKAALLRSALKGAAVAPVEATGSAFARLLADRRLLTDALMTLRSHQRAGHRVVLISASPGIYVRHLGASLGVDAVLCTELAVDDGLFTGELHRRNVRGEEKVHRLDEWLASIGLQREDVVLFAYGDSGGDDALLAAAGRLAQDRRNRRPLRFSAVEVLPQ